MLQMYLSGEVVHSDRKVNLYTLSPKQNPNYEITDDLSPADDYKGCLIVLDDLLLHQQKNISLAYPWYTRNFWCLLLSQRFSELPLKVEDKKAFYFSIKLLKQS